MTDDPIENGLPETPEPNGPSATPETPSEEISAIGQDEAGAIARVVERAMRHADALLRS